MTGMISNTCMHIFVFFTDRSKAVHLFVISSHEPLAQGELL